MNADPLMPLLASLPVAPSSTPPPAVPGISRDALTILVVCAALGVLLLLLVYWWWQARRHHRRHRHHHHHHRHHAQSSPTPAPENAEGPTEDSPAGEHRPHRRRRRRSHRGRNPTLAETGGLPPPRPEGQPPAGL